VISIQRNGLKVRALVFLTDEHCSGVSHICAEDFCADYENRDTSGSAEAQVNLWVSKKGFLHHNEAFIQLFFNLGGVDDALR